MRKIILCILLSVFAQKLFAQDCTSEVITKRVMQAPRKHTTIHRYVKHTTHHKKSKPNFSQILQHTEIKVTCSAPPQKQPVNILPKEYWIGDVNDFKIVPLPLPMEPKYPSNVPEPSTLAILGLGLLGLGVSRRKK